MTHRRLSRPAFAVTLALAAAFPLTACGSDEPDSTAATTTPAAQTADLAPVKDYLLDHTARLERATAKIRTDAESYYALAEAADFDYAALLADKRAEVAQLVEALQQDFHAANPAYEEMEGVVAGVPSLADFDVIIDAGGDGSDPENAVPFSIETPAGRTFEQPGNFNFLIETSVYGTEQKFQAKGVTPDLDGDGKVAFGEAVPDADFLVAAARDFERNAQELADAAAAWEPAEQDVFTALVVMTPTMSEYFESWKNSRFVAGSKATETAFVTSSRLGDISDILGGLVLVYDSVEPRIREVDAEQAEQTGKSLKQLLAFAERLQREETGGRTFTARDADTLGSDAQDRAEAIAGQISQAAGQLDIELES
ncbi:MAG: imelysin family protein [Conexibacter sp.]